MLKKEDDHITGSVDWFIIVLYFLLIIGGWLSIYGASYDYDHVTSLFDFSGRAGMQLVWMGISIIIGFVLLKLDNNLYDILAYFVYAFFIALLIVTIIIAPDIKGSRSWLVITDSIRLQPAEFTKFAVGLAIARFMNSYNFKLLTAKNLLILSIMIILPMVLIMLQKETGSALVFAAFILVLYREGLPGMVLFSGICAVILFIIGLKYSDIDVGTLTMGECISILFIIVVTAILTINFRKDYKTASFILLGTAIYGGICYVISLFDIYINWGIISITAISAVIIYLLITAGREWSKTYLFLALFAIGSIVYVSSVNYVFTDVLQSHQQIRIKVSLGMEDDLMGAGYNVNQSKIAIGSGGALGKGFLNGTQTKLKYVPEQDTDFIFCTVGEEQGFLGSVLVLLGLSALIIRVFFLAERQKNTFGRVYGYGVGSIFLFHLTINVGMVIGLLPVIGIPLPFFSYGGSSLLAFTILLFIFLRLDMARKRR
ncbi:MULTISPECIES: rod shape-determining protein RodA [unclassified Dysgonomonas]|uniref:rod shape-determining protein RodA n=1 Tax=unclassified Dysgonomonas TaxID=2630389 RepID=UPI0006819F58|nr:MULTISPECIES: rod shape-determining protein RodA [unclassified Dysgonomonas]MBD8348372.1 rod shape-determining protein RodA [Dysgonomonas sp. HGC4]MBF0575356.1 rod shape-determining protein RodA [Dysgonomonas sp. GY617]